jgi:hypothetical protein
MSNRDENGRWLPGTSGNPDGRPPKGDSMTEILERLGKDTDGYTGRERRELLADLLWEMAMQGDLSAIKYIFDRIDGAPTTRLNAGIETREPIRIDFEGCPAFDGV